jgi:nitrogen regulatory protein PII-like uncharacterized protein
MPSIVYWLVEQESPEKKIKRILYLNKKSVIKIKIIKNKKIKSIKDLNKINYIKTHYVVIKF